jgi:hypothetical protein
VYRLRGANRFLADQIWTKCGTHKKDRGTMEGDEGE